MPPLPLLVFVVGMGSLGAEIAAVRLLAPYFGASTVVWANTIGVVLVALSLGYWLGGRLADRRPELRGLCLVALAAAALLALVPFAADPLLDVAVDALDSVSAGAFLGSLLAVLVLVAVPVLLLGAVAPYAIRLGVTTLEEAGRVSGRLYAISTAGSLVGTLASSLLLIPLVGTRRTFLVFALAIAVVAVLGLRPLRRYAAVPAAIAALVALPVGTLKAESDSGRTIFETDTEYQYARVVERDDGSRVLELNEGQAQHSLWRPGTVLTGGYWDGMLALPLAGLERPPRRVAILGNAAGTMARAYGRLFPATRVDGAEIDAELSEIGRRYFGLGGPRLELHHEDARPFLRRTDARYDVIAIDAYRQPYIPFYLSTREFFELCRERLAPGGVVVINIGHPEGQTELERVLAATIGEAFPHVLRDPFDETNTLVVAGEGAVSRDGLLAVREWVPGALRGLARAAGGRVGPALGGGEVYTDDRAPVEWLIDRSIVDYAAGE
ncbi:MAG TPA: fused MFS/spermidine synthase [Thermoleophilaceae bacterium]|nr:fused MFS/spermidine synthase [Thermoleophilaceae bacterium]